MMNQPENKDALPFPPEQCSWKKRRDNRLRVSLEDCSRLDLIELPFHRQHTFLSLQLCRSDILIVSAKTSDHAGRIP